MKNIKNLRVIEFCYDLVCPYAYLASLEIEAMGQRCDAKIEYIPVLLGGIYNLSKSTALSSSSSSSSSSPQTKLISRAKQKIMERDFKRMAGRMGVTWPLLMNNNSINTKQKGFSLQAMQMLSAIQEKSHKRDLTHFLFRSLWKDGYDISNESILKQLILEYYSSNGIIQKNQDEYFIKSSEALRKATEMVVANGGFGVPTFFISHYFSSTFHNDNSTLKEEKYRKRMVFGSDSLFFIERFLGRKGAMPFRVMNDNNHNHRKQTKKLTFYYDFSSPWSFIANQRLILLLQKYNNESTKIIELEAVPILLGALFKQLGTANAPLLNLSQNKRNYLNDELTYWNEFILEQQEEDTNSRNLVDASIQWPDQFPIRTVTPLRVIILEPKLRNLIYSAAWQKNQNIGNDYVLENVLCSNHSQNATNAGINESLSREKARTLIMKTKTDKEVKNILFNNTYRAFNAGVCGVPSFQVDDGEVIFGQDRLNVVEDLINGWIDASSSDDAPQSKL